MSGLAWIALAIVAAVIAVGLAQYRAQAGTYRSLASRQPKRRVAPDRQLGSEATDMDLINRTARRNESLERGHVSWTQRGGIAAAMDVTPWADDEKYAARFHTAFHKDRSKDTKR